MTPTDGRLTDAELDRLAALTAAGRLPLPPPPLPGLGAEPTRIATLLAYRRAHLARR